MKIHKSALSSLQTHNEKGLYFCYVPHIGYEDVMYTSSDLLTLGISGLLERNAGPFSSASIPAQSSSFPGREQPGHEYVKQE